MSDAAEVWIWGRRAGLVSEDDSGCITFEYEPAFRRTGLELSPLLVPLSRPGAASFPELHRLEGFAGLPGFLSDALPDRFGSTVIRHHFALAGRANGAIRPVEKLRYMGSRAMGALEFRPAAPRDGESEAIDIPSLLEQARAVVEGRLEVAAPAIAHAGSSAGGMRPKAVVLWNRSTGEIRSAFAPLRPGDGHWIIKFDGVGHTHPEDRSSRPFSRIEHAYACLARDAGIDVAETALLEERGFAHLMVRRFDRDGDSRLHLHSLGGMTHTDFNIPRAFSYERLVETVAALGLGAAAVEEAFRRAVFNVAAVNQDDHVKNFSFLMDQAGAWRLSPAYDLTFARGAGFTRAHQISLNGKTDGFGVTDLLTFGARLGLRQHGREIIERVRNALDGWPRHAGEAGVPEARIRAIQVEFRLR